MMNTVGFFMSLAMILQLGCFSGAQVALPDVPEGEYLLPVGGPNEIVPQVDQQRNLQTTIGFLRGLAGPISSNMTLFMIQGQIPTIPTIVPGLADDVAGQIRPLGVYDNLQKSAEYWFIMPRVLIFRAAVSLGVSFYSLQTQANPTLPVFEASKALIKTAFGDGNMVSFQYFMHAALLRNLTFSEPWKHESTFELSGTYFFDRQGNICGYDVLAPSFSSMWQGGIDPLRQPGFPSQEALAEVPDSPYKRAYLPQPGTTTWLEEICDVATGDMCLPVTGTKFYTDKADCMEQLGKKRVGTYEDLDQDTLTCRALHRMLVPSRPEGHCMHLAADLPEADGGVCIDRTSEPYNDRQFQCGYDDVGYTNAMAKETRAFEVAGYPYTPADLALTDPATVLKEDLDGEGSGCYGTV